MAGLLFLLVAWLGFDALQLASSKTSVASPLPFAPGFEPQAERAPRLLAGATDSTHAAPRRVSPIVLGVDAPPSVALDVINANSEPVAEGTTTNNGGVMADARHVPFMQSMMAAASGATFAGPGHGAFARGGGLGGFGGGGMGSVGGGAGSAGSRNSAASADTSDTAPGSADEGARLLDHDAYAQTDWSGGGSDGKGSDGNGSDGDGADGNGSDGNGSDGNGSNGDDSSSAGGGGSDGSSSGGGSQGDAGTGGSNGDGGSKDSGATDNGSDGGGANGGGSGDGGFNPGGDGGFPGGDFNPPPQQAFQPDVPAAQVVPEPAAMLLSGLGIVAILARRLARRNQHRL